MDLDLLQTYNNYNYPIRTAAYCRVSSNSSEQLNSLNAQIDCYQKYIDENPLLKSAGVFYDVASGRKTQKRLGLKKLLTKCRRKSVDLVITKSICRLGRNTLDTLIILRELSILEIDVFFEEQRLHSIDTKNRTMLEIYAAVAQEDSFSKSKNIKWGINYQFCKGSASYVNRPCFGYIKGKKGHLEINAEQANAVKNIFSLYLEGKSLGYIATYLECEHIPAPNNKEKWSRQTISNILSNEKYAGCVLLQKTYVGDFLSAKQKKNDGELEQYFIEGTHEAIVEKWMFKEAQNEKNMRVKIR